MSKEKKTKGKLKDLRTMIALTCTCVLMLGSATYAWFSVSNTPRVESLALKAGTTGNLKIADAENGPYGDAIDLENAGSGGNMSSVVLNPATTMDGVTFFAPVYNTENAVTGTSAIPEDDLKTKYIYEKEFYLNAEVEGSDTRSRTFDIFLLGSGTYISNTDSGTDQAASAVRISFTIGADPVIYEPNANQHVTGTGATNSLGTAYGGYPTLKQNADKSFEGGTDGHSPRLFTLTANTPTEVTMRVWIEGTDTDCVNDIVADNIVGQIQFISKEVTP